MRRGGNCFRGRCVTAIVTVIVSRSAKDILGLLRAQKRPEALILLGFPAFCGPSWTV